MAGPAIEQLIDSVQEHIDLNRPISAIKRLRELFPELSLKEAHDHIVHGWEDFKHNWRA